MRLSIKHKIRGLRNLRNAIIILTKLRLSIRYKISGLIVILIVIIMGTAGILILNHVKSSFMEELKLRGQTLAHNIAFAAEEPLVNQDDLSLTILVRNSLRSKGAVYTYILDNNLCAVSPPCRIVKEDSILLDYEKWKKKITPAITLPEGADIAGGVVKLGETKIYEVAAPIMIADKKRIGEVHVGIDLSLLEKTAKRIQFLIMFITSVGILVGILGSFSLSQIIVKPIKALVAGVREIGRRNFDQHIDIKSRDELGELTEAFNQMAKDLKEKEAIKDAFKRYVSRQVAEEILKNPELYESSLKGEKRNVAVLFADIRGFTPLAERLPPEDVVEILNYYLSEMADIVFKFEGTIDKFMGDCIMAVFGAPLSRGDDVVRAVESAVKIQEEIRRLNEERIKEGKETVHIGIGINFGEAVVGNIGSKERLEYTVIGDSVNLAARLQTLAKKGEIIVSESVYQAVKRKFEFIPLSKEKVKGKSKYVNLYKVKIPGAEEYV